MFPTLGFAKQSFSWGGVLSAGSNISTLRSVPPNLGGPAPIGYITPHLGGAERRIWDSWKSNVPKQCEEMETNVPIHLVALEGVLTAGSECSTLLVLATKKALWIIVKCAATLFGELLVPEGSFASTLKFERKNSALRTPWIRINNSPLHFSSTFQKSATKWIIQKLFRKVLPSELFGKVLPSELFRKVLPRELFRRKCYRISPVKKVLLKCFCIANLLICFWSWKNVL